MITLLRRLNPVVFSMALTGSLSKNRCENTEAISCVACCLHDVQELLFRQVKKRKNSANWECYKTGIDIMFIFRMCVTRLQFTRLQAKNKEIELSMRLLVLNILCQLANIYIKVAHRQKQEVVEAFIGQSGTQVWFDELYSRESLFADVCTAEHCYHGCC